MNFKGYKSAVTLVLSIYLAAVSGQALAKCEIHISEDGLIPKLQPSLDRISELRLSQQTELHKKIFGVGSTSAGEKYCEFLQKRVEYFSLDECTGNKTEVACFSDGRVNITKQFFDPSRNDISKMETLIHEAQHAMPDSTHILCPRKFEDEKGRTIRSALTGEPIALLNGCDDKPLGAYGVQLVWLDNIYKYCENCSKEEKAFAREKYNQTISRIVDPLAKKIILEDSAGLNVTANLEKFENAVKSRFERVNRLKDFKLSELEFDPKLVKRSLQATTLFKSSQCSGVFVSNDGYLVTALHCLSGVSNDNIFSKFSYDKTSVMVSKEEYVGKKLSIHIPGFEDEDQYYDAEVVFLGRGYPGIFPANMDPLSLSKNFGEKLEDFAVLKFSKMPPRHGCIQIDEDFAPHGQRVWHTGHPRIVTEESDSMRKTNIPHAERLENKRKFMEAWERKEPEALDIVNPKFISTGFAYSSFEDAVRERSYVRVDAAFADLISSPTKFMSSTAAVIGGFSGGGVFTEQGKLVGINSMGMAGASLSSFGTKYSNYAQRFNYGLAAVSIRHIQQTLRDKLSEGMVQEVFHCDE